jgi:AcrR family transcriptional regulator
MARQKDDIKRQNILNAARKLVINTGFTSLRMAEVAQKAGVATGTLYTYYKSKEDLINDAYITTKKEVIELLSNTKLIDKTTYLTLKNIWMAYFYYCHKNPDKMLFVEQFIYSGYIDEAIIEKVDEGLAEVFKHVEKGQNEGIIKNVPIELLQAQIQAPIHDIIKLIHKKQLKLDKNFVDSCFQMTWDALKQ